MREDQLFSAYRKAQLAIEVEEDRDDIGTIKCLVESCPTMISMSARRAICRFHTGKSQRGEIVFRRVDDSSTALRVIPLPKNRARRA